jgi:cysteinyl-tRNA synthetase
MRVAPKDTPAEVLDLGRDRYEARQRKDFVQADKLRIRLEALGWRVEDLPNGYRLVRL